MISTSFALSSIGWEDGVQPLRRHFSWRDASAVSGRWTLLGAWLEPESSQDVMFGSVGTHALRAEMQDALGSVAAAKPQDDSELLILVSDAKDAGDTPDILATAHAVSLASTNSTPTSAMRLPDAVRTACGFANRFTSQRHCWPRRRAAFRASARRRSRGFVGFGGARSQCWPHRRDRWSGGRRGAFGGGELLGGIAALLPPVDETTAGVAAPLSASLRQAAAAVGDALDDTAFPCQVVSVVDESGLTLDVTKVSSHAVVVPLQSCSGLFGLRIRTVSTPVSVSAAALR